MAWVEPSAIAQGRKIDIRENRMRGDSAIAYGRKKGSVEERKRCGQPGVLQAGLLLSRRAIYCPDRPDGSIVRRQTQDDPLLEVVIMRKQKLEIEKVGNLENEKQNLR
ncbi:hypothetical protein ACLOJK_023824 [Asimina triloba]